MKNFKLITTSSIALGTALSFPLLAEPNPPAVTDPTATKVEGVDDVHNQLDTQSQGLRATGELRSVIDSAPFQP